jgi:hypothetical protein
MTSEVIKLHNINRYKPKHCKWCISCDCVCQRRSYHEDVCLIYTPLAYGAEHSGHYLLSYERQISLSYERHKFSNRALSYGRQIKTALCHWMWQPLTLFKDRWYPPPQKKK